MRKTFSVKPIMANNLLKTASGALIPNAPVWARPARDELALRWREAIESLAWCMYEEHRAGMEEEDEDFEHRPRGATRDQMLHAMVAEKTTLSIDGREDHFWNDTYVGSAADPADRVILAQWLGTVGGATLSKSTVLTTNENLANAILAVLNHWVISAWTGVDPPKELRKHMVTYARTGIMADAGSQVWPQVQPCVYAFLDAWLDAARRPGHHPQKPYATPPVWMNRSIISLQLIGSVEQNLIDPALVLKLDDFLKTLKRSADKDPDGLFSICQSLGDRARLTAVEVKPDVPAGDSPRHTPNRKM
jgi:hypothetical protein